MKPSVTFWNGCKMTKTWQETEIATWCESLFRTGLLTVCTAHLVKLSGFFCSGTKILRQLSHIRCRSIFTVQLESNSIHHSPRCTTRMMSPCKLMDFFRPLATNNCLLIRPDFPIVFEQEAALSLSRLSSVIVHLKLNNLMIHQRVACWVRPVPRIQ